MDIFSIFFDIKVCYVFSLEYTQYKILNFKIKKITLNYLKSAAMGFFSKEEFKTAVVNEPSVFEPLKFFCNYILNLLIVQSILC